MDIEAYLLLIFLVPLVIWSALWAAFALAYPFMFLYGAAVSSSRKREWMGDILERERATLSTMGRDILSMDKIRVPWTATDSEVIWTSIVIGPSHWQQLIGLIYNLLGGSVDVYRDMIAMGRAEVFQRLREMATERGFDDVVAVRLDTSMIGTHRSKGRGAKGIEIFAYGTGIRKLDGPESFVVNPTS